MPDRITDWAFSGGETSGAPRGHPCNALLRSVRSVSGTHKAVYIRGGNGDPPPCLGSLLPNQGRSLGPTCPVMTST